LKSGKTNRDLPAARLKELGAKEKTGLRWVMQTAKTGEFGAGLAMTVPATVAFAAEGFSRWPRPVAAPPPPADRERKESK